VARGKLYERATLDAMLAKVEAAAKATLGDAGP
jgi:hypothetical protein